RALCRDDAPGGGKAGHHDGAGDADDATKGHSAMSNVVEVRQLTKSYGDVTAVNHVSFCIEAGKIYGLMGRNGAGKPTLMRILTAQEFATGGEANVFGEVPYENSRVLRRICFVKDTQTYPKYYRVSDMLEVAPLFFPKWDREYAFALADDFRLPLN